MDKGVIDLDKIAAKKAEELKSVKQDAELTRRVEEDKKIQAAEMQKDKTDKSSPEEEKKTPEDASEEQKGDKV